MGEGRKTAVWHLLGVWQTGAARKWGHAGAMYPYGPFFGYIQFEAASCNDTEEAL